ncbi:hypothetical protein T492DRAFT_838291 [Pavlovales sp. CCMP2436]|nr:hypothetical protein T492DRAFT_838291 [Pavlovales sp. CCMP2436]
MTGPTSSAMAQKPGGDDGVGTGLARWVGAVRYRTRGETGYTAFELEGEHYRLGDTVLLKAEEAVDKDYVARIESLWETATGEKAVEVRWYYFPEHTRGGRLKRHHKREVFESTHTDENTVDTIQVRIPPLLLRWSRAKIAKLQEFS